MATRATTTIAALAGVAIVLALPLGAATAGQHRPLARNVILLIDDGAGYATHEIGSLYDTGLPDGEAYQGFPFRFGVSNHSYGDVAPPLECGELVGYDPALAWSDWSYRTIDPTDSAASATAMATGTKTYDGAVGMGCTTAGVTNIVEIAERMGKATGVVSSVPVSHATPASFVAHYPTRTAEPTLAEQMFESSATDVIMGAGHPWFDRVGKPVTKPGYVFISKSTWDKLVAGTAGADADGNGDADPFTLVQTRAEFQALATGDTPSRVAGVAQIRRTLQEERVDLRTLPPGTVFAPYELPFIETVPTLAEMAAGALNVLDDDPDGLFLMIEGGATDWAASANQPGFLVEEEIAFDRAVDEVLSWVDLHSNWGETLVIVVSDHETGYVTGPGSGDTPDGPVWTPVVNNGIGVLPGFEFNLDGHTNTIVPVYAKGDAGRLLRGMVLGTDPVHGDYVDNTDIFRLMNLALGAG